MLGKARSYLLDDGDIAILNDKITTTVLIQNKYKNVVIMYQNVI